MTARQRHHLRTRAHQRARREGRTVMAGMVNVMVAPSPLLTSGSRASDDRAITRIWEIRARTHPQGRGAADRFHYAAARVLFGDGA